MNFSKTNFSNSRGNKLLIVLLYFQTNYKYINVILMSISRYISDDYISAQSAYVGLAPQGDVGSWQRECKVIETFLSGWTKLFCCGCIVLGVISFYIYMFI